jgi:uncharacterized protein (DUF2147 family)
MMNSSLKTIIFVFLAILSLLPASAFSENVTDQILGVWHTTDDKSQVQIFKVKNQYFGRIISLKEPNWPANDELGMGGKPKTDRRNPNHELQNRPIVGLQLMAGFVPAGKNLWADGKIYDPESGKTYKCKLTLVGDKRLEVRGYVGFSLFGRTEVWTR